MLQKKRAVLQNFADATQYEWLETNGLGGWSGSSIIGANTRRYHGLLTAAIHPPAERMVLLSKLEETIAYDGQRHELGVNLYPGDTIHPHGHHYLKSFRRKLFPEWEYEIDDITIRKTIAMIHGENTVVVCYEVIKASGGFLFELAPLTAARGYHALQKAGPHMHWDATFTDSVFHAKPDGITDLFIRVPDAEYGHEPCWYNNFQYQEEKNRGLDFEEDLFRHGRFSKQLKKGDTLYITISTAFPSETDGRQLVKLEKQRRLQLLDQQPEDEYTRKLVLSADQFIVDRPVNGQPGKSVIAGYPWFTDWGRDTMISLPGLTLSTGRLEDAKNILKAFAASVSEGMLPNRFCDNGEPPEYNNVDGTLWFFIAAYRYYGATDERQFIIDEILPVLEDIIAWHKKGTRYHIHCTEDGLLYAGEKGQQLTWMDAKIGDWVVTPRSGKAVEIQALWYNALRITGLLLEENNKKEEATAYRAMAAKVKENFNKIFWDDNLQSFADVVNEDGTLDTTLRPNQLLAISLPFSLAEGKRAAMVLKTVTQELYTPAGLRTLPQGHPLYIPHYTGDQWQRDASYHQGTVWSWLLGPYVDAIMKVNGEKGKPRALKVIQAFRYHLHEGCIGSVSEIADAEPPHYPRGAVAQAWSVAELLRVITEYKLSPQQQKKKNTRAAGKAIVQ